MHNLGGKAGRISLRPAWPTPVMAYSLATVGRSTGPPLRLAPHGGPIFTAASISINSPLVGAASRGPGAVRGEGEQPAAQGLGHAVSQEIEAAEDAATLLQLAERHMAQLSSKQAVLLLSRLAQTGYNVRRPAADAAGHSTTSTIAQQLVAQLARDRLRNLPPSQVAHVATVLRNLRCKEPRMLQAIEQQSLACAARLTVAHWVKLSASFCVLRHSPTAEWLAQLQSSVVQQSASTTAADVAAIMWSFATFNVPPSRDWVDAMLEISYAGLGGCSTSQLSNLAYALTKLGLNPGFEWTRALVAAFVAELDKATPQHLVNVLMLAQRVQQSDVACRLEPQAADESADAEEPSMQSGEGAAIGEVHEFGRSLSFATASAAFNRLAATPRSTDKALVPSNAVGREEEVEIYHHLNAIAREVSRKLSQCQPQELSNALSAMDALRLSVPEELPAAVCSYVQAHISKFQLSNLSNVLLRLQKMGHLPPQDWVSSVIASSAAVMPSATSAALLNFLQVLMGWSIHPGGRWRAAFMSAAHKQLPQMSASQLASLLWGMVSIDVVPDTGWLRSYEAASLKHLEGHLQPGGTVQQAQAAQLGSDTHPSRMPKGEEVGTPSSLAAPPQDGDDADADSGVNIAQSRLGASRGRELSVTLAGLACCNYIPQERWRLAYIKQLAACWRAMQPRRQSYVLWALAKLRVVVPDDNAATFVKRAMLRQLVSELPWAASEARQSRRAGAADRCSLLPSMNGHGFSIHIMGSDSFVRLIWALSQLFEYDRAWLLREQGAALQQMAGMTLKELASLQPWMLAEILSSFASLSYHPGEAWVSRVEERCLDLGPESFSHQQWQKLEEALQRLDLIAGSELP